MKPGKKRTIKEIPLHRQPIKNHTWTAGEQAHELKAKLIASTQAIMEKRQAAIEECKKLYEATDNPLFVWDAYRICRRGGGESFPEWILIYLDGTANALMDDANTHERDIPALLGFAGKGQGSKFKQYSKEMVREHARAIVSLYLNEGKNFQDAVWFTADLIHRYYAKEYSLETIRKWYEA